MANETAPSSPSQNSTEPPGPVRTVLAVFSGVLFGLFLSKFKTPPEQAINGIPQNTEINDKNDGGEISPSLSTQIPPSPQAAQNPCKCCHHKIPRWKIILDWLMFSVTTGAFLAAGWYAVITNKMWREMERQTCVQRESATDSERAWVGLDSTPQVEVSSLKQEKFTARIVLTLKNFGKGPAFNVFTNSQIALHGRVEDAVRASCNLIFPFVGLQPSMPVSSSEDISRHRWGQIVFPGQTFSSGIETSLDSEKIVGQEVFIVGCIVYKDQFEQAHWTKFSYSTGPYLTLVVQDASSFRHLYVSHANNYTDDVEKKSGCPVGMSR